MKTNQTHEKLERLVLAALFAALTCTATMVLQIPSPMSGYVNLGDCFVLLSGVFLGPVWGFLAAGTGSSFQFSDVVWGEITGPIGATAILVLIAAAVFLFLRNTASVYITLPYLLTCAVMALLFPRGTDSQAFYSLVIELCSGYLLFAGVFMFTDPVTSPRYTPARVVYGALAGILVMILRHFGRFEEGACFAVLIMNAFAAPLDRGCWRLVRYWRKGGKRYGNPE